ncbi:ketoacyl-ACP synthase III [Herbaspirillum sp. RTI4]|uniref:3-oxoacyl-ACP synthase III family protein n=1 Tax=Herbaspirillum sp. RTI4 TaxID=3048640 RepID=UPI002AB54452|nr:ketoacyl-ACP synthase III [Herbaspirillum sp. RTI4]MDY7577044.1 ketoacyl-ACP synthase III [Herbaspirillum sp. RTI4]MEA9982224.1 ketoacyl-ACP synthase III [Herbaspirillum sp. RTI4]
MYSIAGVAIRGIAAVVPKGIERTENYEILTPEERTRFAKITGIEERRVANAAQCASDLCAFATEDLLKGLEWQKQDVGMMVLITQSPDYPVPATSIVLQNKLGLNQSCICFDVNLGCSAYPYGLAIVSGLMKSLGIKRALLLVGDVSTKSCAYTDKGSWPLFSDAGTATALELSDADAPMQFHLMNDGAGYGAIIVPSGYGASRVPITQELLEPVPQADGTTRHAMQLVLQGADIFNFAIREAPLSINTLLTTAGVPIGDVDYVVLHQANKLINDTVRMKIGAPKERALSTLKQYGNSSSASIPLTLCAHGGQLQDAPLVLLSGFGVGLSWGSALVKLPEKCFFSLNETDQAFGQ